MPNPFTRGTPSYQMYEEAYEQAHRQTTDQIEQSPLDPWPFGTGMLTEPSEPTRPTTRVDPTGIRFEYSPMYAEERQLNNPYSSPRLRVRDNDYASVPLDSWMTSDGTVIKIENLETPHLLSVLSVLYKDQNRAPQQRNKMVTLEKEVVKRFTA